MINYYLLTKPNIVLGNLITLAAGFLLASKGKMDVWLFFATLFGLSLIMASACVFNNYIDRQIDQRMERTKNRALVIGLISARDALLFAVFLGILGTTTLYFFTNLLTVYVATFGFFVYVILYSLWKCHTVYGTAIGSLAGAVPPVAGYCAVSNQIDVGAAILFTLLVLWQMPHFFAIALYRLEDYAAAGIPVLPVVKGISRTKIHMFIYVIGFVMAALMLTFFNYTGYVYFAVTTLVGLVWIRLSLQGFKTQEDRLWGKNMYRCSLWMIISLCVVIPFDIVS
ncbi:heme o synthase [Parachlamydia sp. AcF125]|uniref:heme o synthase n=1 Tax=Parachlamydia sp. AcF125 TaxID=2795736 RepID=UPI001BC90F5E|nr:heme o synthase [Parachlamydia sp. AcF125]MBS4167818.1 Protoheme IX farnesyltransferase [Parachlamydia sp. AcF125]